jgi:adenosylhomocysteine nucleosidase
MICYAFPLAHEAGQVLKHCTQKESFSIGKLHCTVGNYRGRQILVALIGMGQEQAREHTEKIFQYFRPKALILAGYGGALVAPLKVGQVVVSTNFSSEQLIPFLRLLSGFDFATFCTADEIVSTREKRDYYARTSRRQVVDMETQAVAEVVHGRDLPFLAVRAISDDYHQVLPTGALAAGFDPIEGRVTPVRLLVYLATHLQEIAPFKHFVTGLSLARRNLTNFMGQLSEELPPGW